MYKSRKGYYNKKSVKKSDIFIMVVVMVAFVLGISSTLKLKYYPLIIISDSMEPTILANSLSICEREDFNSIEVGDIITYDNNGYTVTHRVIDVDDNVIYTKGDNNATDDKISITEEMYKGKIVYTFNWIASVYNSIIKDRSIDFITALKYILISIVSLIVLIYIVYTIRDIVKEEIKNKYTKNELKEDFNDCVDEYISEVNDYIDDMKYIVNHRNRIMNLTDEDKEDIDEYTKLDESLTYLRKSRENIKAIKHINKVERKEEENIDDIKQHDII